MLGAKKVGWIFAHPPREKKYVPARVCVFASLSSLLSLPPAHRYLSPPPLPLTPNPPPPAVRFHFSGAEAIFAAEQQLLAADGVADALFVTVKVSLDEEGRPQAEAYQVTKQCMEMAAEGALLVGPNLGACLVHPTFTAIVEGRPTKEVLLPLFFHSLSLTPSLTNAHQRIVTHLQVDTDFFLGAVPVGAHESLFLSTFPRANRSERPPTVDDLRRQLAK